MKTIQNIITLAALTAAFAACSLGGDVDAWRAAAGVSDTDYYMPYPVVSFPSGPENLRITENSAYSLAVEWNSVSGADYYFCFISSSRDFDEYTTYAFDTPSTYYHLVHDNLWSYIDTLYIKVCAYQYGYGGGYDSSVLYVSRPSGWTGNVTAAALSENQWFSDSINSSTSNTYKLYSIYVNSWQTYYVWWDDADNGGGTLDIRVMVSANEDGSGMFFDQDVPNEASFTPSSSGTVYVRVYPYSSGNTGSYGIAYSASSNRP